MANTNRRAWLRGAAAAGAALLLSAGGGIEEDELLCEEAVAHVSDCCPEAGLENVECVDDGCSDQRTFFAIAESECLCERSCEELVEQGICERVDERAAAPFADPPVEVCP